VSHSPSPLTASQKQAIGALKKNGLVDVKWYEKNYQDAAILGMNPLEHFVRYGLLLQRDPHPDVVLSFLQDAIPNLQTATPSETLMMLGADWVSQIDPGRVLWAASRLAETADPTGRKFSCPDSTTRSAGRDARAKSFCFDACFQG